MRALVVAGTQCTAAALTAFADALRQGLGMAVETAVVRRADLADAADTLVESGDDLLLVGHSLGGTVCLAAARRHPNRVRGLALVATNPAGPRPDQFDAWAQQEELARTAGPAAVADRIMTHLIGDDDGSPSWAERAALMREMAQATGLNAYLAQLAVQRARVDELPGVAEFAGPVLAVAADADRLVPAESHLRIADAAVDGESLQLNGTHMLVLDRPTDLAAAITDWWSRRGAPTIHPVRNVARS